MALVVADRVQETTTTTGTGTYTLAGAKDGFQSFAAVGDGNTTYYACTDGTDYEVGIGTYTASGTTLARTTIIESSNDSPSANAAVDWGAGSKDIFVTLPASKAVVLDSNNDATFSGDIKLVSGSLTSTLQTDTLNFDRTITFPNASGVAVLQTGSTTGTATPYLRSLVLDGDFNAADVSLSFREDTGLYGTLGFRHIYDGGLNEYYFQNSPSDGTYNTIFMANRTTGNTTWYEDVIFTSGTVNITFDASGSAFKFDDGARAYFGSGSDLTIYHEGVSSETRLWNITGDINIKNSAVDKDVVIETDNGSGFIQPAIIARGTDGNVILNGAGFEKLSTNSFGLDVTGRIYLKSPTGYLIFEGTTDDTFETIFRVINPTQDNNIYLPNESGTVATRSRAFGMALLFGG